MPLRIQCPNGCVMRVPAKRAGMSARCPGCKSIVVVPYPPADHNPNDILLAPFSSSHRSAIDEVSLPEPVKPPQIVEIQPKETIDPRSIENLAAESEADKQPEKVPFAINIEDSEEVEKKIDDSANEFKIEPSADLKGKNREGNTLSSAAAIEKRTRQAQADRVTLTRFFAGFLVVVGLINLGPAVYCWWEWSQADAGILLPRWIYLQIFVAVLHIVYAILLLQVPDWSALKSIAFVMLVFAFVYGLFSMGLVVSGSTGLLARFLQVPGSLSQKACIWCVAMLVLATLASYLAGRESNHWQRTEKLLAEVLAKSSSTNARDRLV